MRRPVVLLASLALVVLALTAAVAMAAKPAPGEWNGNKARFVVNAAGTKITNFSPGGCAANPVPIAMKVKNGKFTFKKKFSFEGGGSETFKISGKFTTATTAKGVVHRGARCTVKFTAKAPPPEPVEPVVTEEQPTPDY